MMNTGTTRRYGMNPHRLDARHGEHHAPEPVQPHERPTSAVRALHPRGERVAITGSRERWDKETIEAVIDDLPTGTIVLTGGAAGPDSWAETAARRRGLAVETFAPELPEHGPGYLYTKAFYKRNSSLVAACDRLIAFPIGPRGGTWHTIGQAVELGKPVTIVPCPRSMSEPRP